jgi:hypothetical protein
MNLLQACQDQKLFGRWFKEPATWESWFAFIAALFALSMSTEQLAIYQRHTGRQTPPAAPIAEGWLVCGRRAGKSFVLAVIAVWRASRFTPSSWDRGSGQPSW